MDNTSLVDEMNASISKLEAILEPFLSVSLKDLANELDPIEYASLQNTYLATLLTLTGAYIRVSGVSMKTEPLSKEFLRLKNLKDRIDNVKKSSL